MYLKFVYENHTVLLLYFKYIFHKIFLFEIEYCITAELNGLKILTRSGSNKTKNRYRTYDRQIF